MRYLAILAVLLAITACGTHKDASPTEVARAWSAALNGDDSHAAAKLFAGGAQIIQDGVLTLQTRADAETWNAGLPCGGRITSIEQQGPDRVLVVFTLTERPHHRCDAPGAAAAALFQVDHGKIVLWHQTEVPSAAPAV